jgi:hypothetical protein
MVGEMKHNAFPGRHIDTNKSDKIDGSGLLDIRVLFLYSYSKKQSIIALHPIYLFPYRIIVEQE